MNPIEHPDSRVKPIALDITEAEQIKAAVEAVGSLDLLINNAGIASYDDLSDPDVIARHLAVNRRGRHLPRRHVGDHG